jgi:hypothetical protein
MAQVLYADTGEVEKTLPSPFQKPACTNIKVTVHNSPSGSVPSLLVFTARQGNHKVTRTVPL